MKEHALFIHGLLDPTEYEFVEPSENGRLFYFVTGNAGSIF